MNSLSWLLYAADAVDTAKGVTLTGMLLSVPALVASFLWTEGDERTTWDSAMRDHRNYPTLYPKRPEGPRPDVGHPYRKTIKPVLIGLVLFAVATTVIPTRNTVYAIAASELGQRALETPTASKAVAALNAWLDRQIQAPAK